MLREKRHWENQISSLGGPHYRRYGPKMFDAEGREVPGNRGYKYFGAAKDLPGVRELFEQEPPPPSRKTRAELMREVDASYYGYMDDEDGILNPLEEKAERIALQKSIEEWKLKVKKGDNLEADEAEIYKISEESVSVSSKEKQTEVNDPMSLLGPRFTAHVPVPSQKDIEDALLRKKKQELLAKYGMNDE